MALLAFSTPSLVSANEAEQSQELEQEFDVKCTSSGTYGQDTNCEVSGKQKAKQHQKVVVLGAYHDATKINAGLDTKTSIVFALVAITGLSSGAYLVKSKVSN